MSLSPDTTTPISSLTSTSLVDTPSIFWLVFLSSVISYFWFEQSLRTAQRLNWLGPLDAGQPNKTIMYNLASTGFFFNGKIKDTYERFFFVATVIIIIIVSNLGTRPTIPST
jgi:DNA-binding transcriptional regulator PaaX